MLKLERSMAFSSPYMQYAPEPKPDVHRAVVYNNGRVEFVAESHVLRTLNNALRRSGYADLLKKTKKVANGKN